MFQFPFPGCAASRKVLRCLRSWSPHLQNGLESLPSGLVCDFHGLLLTPCLGMGQHTVGMWSLLSFPGWRPRQWQNWGADLAACTEPETAFHIESLSTWPHRLIPALGFFFFPCCICQYHKYLQGEEKIPPDFTSTQTAIIGPGAS